MLLIIKNRRGFTLVELLIVITIATLLAALSLSTIQGLLKDQKISQSVRLVRQYFETARTRAMATGRPVALFLERVSPEGDSTGMPVVANYTVTRMSIGEVFPPYTGEVSLATATLWDTPVGSPAVTSRPGGDGFADQARFLLAEVVTAFGTATTPGMVSIGDTIEFVGNKQRFVIESIDYVGGEVAVTFFNPPATYDAALGLKIINGVATDNKFEVSYSGREPSLPTRNPTLSGMTATTPVLTPTPVGVEFRIYRKPSKSLVGTITMPRGTCIDLSVSGIGPSSSGWDASSPFHLATAPSSTVTGALKRSSYSRIAVVFNPEGRANGIYQDNRIVGTGTPEVASAGSYTPFGLSTKIHFMVGRTEQVIPDAPLTAPATGDRGDAKGNLMDTANTWISINPFTGLIESSPVAAISDTTLAAAQAAIAGGNAATITQKIQSAVQEARSFSAMGVNDGGR